MARERQRSAIQAQQIAKHPETPLGMLRAIKEEARNRQMAMLQMAMLGNINRERATETNPQLSKPLRLKKDWTIREELQSETDEWLKDVL